MFAALRLLAWIMTGLAALGAISFAVAMLNDEGQTVPFWSLYVFLLLFLSVSLFLSTNHDLAASSRRQAIMTPLLVVCVLPILCMAPFWGLVTKNAAIDALFEAVSAMSTSGSTAMAPLVMVPDSILIWRVLLEWYCGWLFLVFAVAIQPQINIAGMALSANHFPRLETRSFYRRVCAVAVRIARGYLLITALGILLLMLCQVRAPIAIPLGLTAVATGGFLPFDEGLSRYGSPLTYIATILVLFLGCLNITLFYSAMRGQFSRILRGEEFRAFLRLIALAFLAIFTVSAFSSSFGVTDFGVVDIAFLSLSAVSTTALSPLGTQTASLSLGILLISICIIGGMSGSSTGGLKVLRSVLIDRFVNAELTKLGNPHRIRPVEYNNRIIRISDMMGVWSLVLVIASTIAIGSLILSALKMPFLSAIVTSVAMLSNAGNLPYLIDPSFAGYAALSPFMQVTCIVLMILGKLEFLLILSWVFNRLR